MYPGQSFGFGTKLGDQQYVNGTLSCCINKGPSAMLIGSSWML